MQARTLYSDLASHPKRQIDNGSVSLLDVYERILNKISDLDKVSADGARVCSRVKWAEEGEASTRFFLCQERKWASESWISAMRRPDGSVVTDISSICSSWVEFYSSLFSAEPVDSTVQDDLLSNVQARLPAGTSDLCEGLLTIA